MHADGASTVTTTAVPTAVIAQATTWKAFPALWRQLLDEVWAFVRSADVSPGRNIMLYKDDVPNVEVGVEVAGPFAPHGRVVPSALPAGRAVRAVSRGAPSAEGLAAAYDAIHEWCAANGVEPTRVHWEVYDHWRDEPESFETEVYWLLGPAE